MYRRPAEIYFYLKWHTGEDRDLVNNWEVHAHHIKNGQQVLGRSLVVFLTWQRLPPIIYQDHARQLAVTQEVDYALIVCRKQSDCVFEEEHEGCVDHTVRQFVGIDLVERWRWRQNVMERQWQECNIAWSNSRQFIEMPLFSAANTKTLTLKSSSTSIWFWMMGIVLRSFSVFMVLITPSDLGKERITH